MNTAQPTPEFDPFRAPGNQNEASHAAYSEYLNRGRPDAERIESFLSSISPRGATEAEVSERLGISRKTTGGNLRTLEEAKRAFRTGQKGSFTITEAGKRREVKDAFLYFASDGQDRRVALTSHRKAQLKRMGRLIEILFPLVPPGDGSDGYTAAWSTVVYIETGKRPSLATAQQEYTKYLEDLETMKHTT